MIIWHSYSKLFKYRVYIAYFFLVDKIQSVNPITYRLKDLNNGKIQGSFYEPDLLKDKTRYIPY